VSAPGVKRWSIDCKATVKIGEFSRGGLTRGDHRASDHDMGCQEKYVPCGIVDEASGALHITFGSSYKTSDFIVDTIEAKWEAMAEQEQAETSLIQIKMDNGPESSGRRTQFLSRMVQLADRINKPLQLLYYPPYHSKYNPIERCWGDLGVAVEWDEADRCRDDAGVGEADDLEGDPSDRRTEPQNVPKGHLAREGGDAGG
jgi:hypothetical protein